MVCTGWIYAEITKTGRKRAYGYLSRTGTLMCMKRCREASAGWPGRHSRTFGSDLFLRITGPCPVQLDPTES